MTAKTNLNPNAATPYATGDDFCRIFHEDMKSLYLLALLVTADHEKAEQCFVSGLEDSAAGNPVFKEWARSWARRTIIKNAIRLIAPEPLAVSAASNAGAASTRGNPIEQELRAETAAVLFLRPFARFAFVMSVLEGYSDRECTLLLGCTRESLIAARTEALQQIGKQPAINMKPELPGNRNSAFELKIHPPLAIPA